MWPIFEQALTRYQELEQQLGDPVVVADRARFTRTAKEHGALAKRVKPYLEYKKISDDLAQAQALLDAESDPEMRLRCSHGRLEPVVAAQPALEPRARHSTPLGGVVGARPAPNRDAPRPKSR